MCGTEPAGDHTQSTFRYDTTAISGLMFLTYKLTKIPSHPMKFGHIFYIDHPSLGKLWDSKFVYKSHRIFHSQGQEEGIWDGCMVQYQSMPGQGSFPAAAVADCIVMVLH
jgi:hypothetical protein